MHRVSNLVRRLAIVATSLVAWIHWRGPSRIPNTLLAETS